MVLVFIFFDIILYKSVDFEGYHLGVVLGFWSQFSKFDPTDFEYRSLCVSHACPILNRFRTGSILF